MAKKLPTWEEYDLETLQRFARVKLIAADLDGTLLKKTSNHLFETIHNLIGSLKHKCNVTVATGRTFEGVSTLLEMLKIDKSVPIIVYNGSVIYNHQKNFLVDRKIIPLCAINDILDMCRSFKLNIFSYSFQNPSFSNSQKLELVMGWKYSSFINEEANGMDVIWVEDDVVYKNNEIDPPSALLIDLRRNKLDNIQSFISLIKTIDGITITNSGSEFIEVRPVASNKASALEILSRSIAIERNDILALGDNDNDAEMLQWAGIGVAVSDASELAQKNSDFICNHGVAEGAVEVLRLVKTAKRFFSKL